MGSFGSETAGHSARLLDQKEARGQIPRFESQFEKSVQPAGRHRRQVQSGRTRPTDAGDLGEEGAELFEIDPEPAEIPEREAGSDERFVQVDPLRDADAAVVEERTLPAASDEQFITGRVIDHPGFENPAAFEGNGDGIDGEAMEEVGGSIQRIHDPAFLARRSGRSHQPAFLRQDGVIRMGGSDHLDDGRFGGPVDLAHEIVGRLLLHPDAVEPVGLAADHLAGPAGGPDGDLDDGLHGRDAGRRPGS